MHDLQAATQATAAIVRGVGEDQLELSTPCPDYTVGDLLDHVAGLAVAFTMAASKTPVEAQASGNAQGLPSDWRSVIPGRLQELAQAWTDPAAWTGQTRAGGVDLDGGQAGQVALNEVIVHGWDLARATGQSIDIDDASIAGAEAFVSLFSGPGTEEMRVGLFGPEVQPPADASPLEHLIAMTGRDPAWSPTPGEAW